MRNPPPHSGRGQDVYFGPIAYGDVEFFSLRRKKGETPLSGNARRSETVKIILMEAVAFSVEPGGVIPDLLFDLLRRPSIHRQQLQPLRILSTVDTKRPGKIILSGEICKTETLRIRRLPESFGHRIFRQLLIHLQCVLHVRSLAEKFLQIFRRRVNGEFGQVEMMSLAALKSETHQHGEIPGVFHRGNPLAVFSKFFPDIKLIRLTDRYRVRHSVTKILNQKIIILVHLFMRQRNSDSGATAQKQTHSGKECGLKKQLQFRIFSCLHLLVSASIASHGLCFSGGLCRPVMPFRGVRRIESSGIF